MDVQLFGQRLKELRIKRGMTQEDVEAKTGIARQSIGIYESGTQNRMPRPKRLIELAEFFNVTVDYLTGAVDDPHMTLEDMKKKQGKTEEPGIDVTEKSHELTPAEQAFLKDLELPLEKIAKKYTLTINGEPATEEEIEYAIKQVTELRQFLRK
jgi:transcriptional regulator with XRE-family HTH domain